MGAWGKVSSVMPFWDSIHRSLAAWTGMAMTLSQLICALVVLTVLGQFLLRKHQLDLKKQRVMSNLAQRNPERPMRGKLITAMDVLFVLPVLSLIIVFISSHYHVTIYVFTAVFSSASSVTWYAFRYLEHKKNPLIVNWTTRLVAIACTLLPIFVLISTSYQRR